MEDTQETESVELVESQSEDDSEKRPIMILLKRLIRNKQNTVMTNTQIIEILKEEFDIHVKTCHELEVDIYIKIIKKYLKDWPQWEELERISAKLSCAKDYDAVTKVLNHKYKNLKEYLGVMLEAAQPFAKKAVAEIEPQNKCEIHDVNAVSMEIYCTRKQLNHLFYRRPNPHLNNTIFNLQKINPTRIKLNTLSFESILNCWWTKVYLSLPNFVFFRELSYKFKHTLINKARPGYTVDVPETLDTRVYNRGKASREFSKASVLKYFDKILNLATDEDIKQILQVIFGIIKKDLEDLPDILKIPSAYRKYGNKYKYVRHLSVDNEEIPKNSKYDLQLEEVVAPAYQLFLGKFLLFQDLQLLPLNDWLKIECLMCKSKFLGSTEIMSLIQAHFNDCHQNEPDWQCSNCKRPFSMDFLSKSKWSHEC